MATQRTVFGTETDSPLIRSLSLIGYGCATVLTLYMAFEGISVIRADAPFVVRCAFAGVIALVLGSGLKLFLWNMPRFNAWMLFFTLLGSSPALFFNFIGMYHVTGERTIVRQERDQAQDVLRAYDTLVRREIGKAESDVEQGRTADLAAQRQAYMDELTLLERRLANARLLEQDEKLGVPGDGLSGVPGVDDHARMRESDTRRAQANYDIDKKRLEDQNTARIDEVNGRADGQLARLKKAVELLDKMIGYDAAGEGSLEKTALSSEAADGVLEEGISSSDEIAEAESLDELDEAGRRANKLMAEINSEYTAATGKSLDPRGVDVKQGNLFDLSVRGLMALDISALVSFLVALGLDWLDTIIVYGIRRMLDDEREIAAAAAAASAPATP